MTMQGGERKTKEGRKVRQKRREGLSLQGTQEEEQCWCLCEDVYWFIYNLFIVMDGGEKLTTQTVTQHCFSSFVKPYISYR